jgi:hypothetical protein
MHALVPDQERAGVAIMAICHQRIERAGRLHLLDLRVVMVVRRPRRGGVGEKAAIAGATATAGRDISSSQGAFKSRV